MANGYSKVKLMEALSALSIATEMGVFTQPEKKEVLEAIKAHRLSPTVAGMLDGRHGYCNEYGQLDIILDFFTQEGG